MIGIDLYQLPSVGISERERLPEDPGIYLLCDGSLVLYVGKSLNIKARHSHKEGHSIYKKIESYIFKNSNFLRIRWASFSNISLSGKPLNSLLLAYEDHLIKTFNPLWNERCNGEYLTQEIASFITMQIAKSNGDKKMNETNIAIDVKLAPIKDEHSLSVVVSQSKSKDEFKTIALNVVASRRSNLPSCIKSDWDLNENYGLMEMVNQLRAASSKNMKPAYVIEQCLSHFCDHLNKSGNPTSNEDADQSFVDSFSSAFSEDGFSLSIADLSLHQKPNISLEEMILRATGKNIDQVSASDYAVFSLFHSSHPARKKTK